MHFFFPVLKQSLIQEAGSTCELLQLLASFLSLFMHSMMKLWLVLEILRSPTVILWMCKKHHLSLISITQFNFGLHV